MNLNRVFILGNLVADPEARMTASGMPVANFRVATNRIYKDKEGRRQEQAEFHNVVAWGRQAEIVREYLKRGRLVFVEGRLQTRSWEGQDGQKRWRTEIITERVQLGPRPLSSSGTNEPYTKRAVPQTETSRDTQEKTQEEEIPIVDEDAPISFDDNDSKEIDPKEIPF